MSARVFRFFIAGIACLGLCSASPVLAGSVDLPRFPSINPDGSEVVFSWGGDLWRVPIEGGEASRLTRHPLDDLHSSWSPDGRNLVFTSMRDGYLNLWRIRRDGSRAEQLTHSDRFLRHPGWFGDPEDEDQTRITFSSLLEGDVYREERPYAIPPEGGDHQRLHDAFGSRPAISPDGDRVAFTRGGQYHGWSRRNYVGPEAMDVWIHDRNEDRFEAVTDREGDDGDALWAGDNHLIFMSDRELDTVNLFAVDLEDPDRIARRLTDFTDRDIQHFDVSKDGSQAVMQVWNRIYRLDLEDPEAQAEPISLRAADDGRDEYTLRRVDRDITETALSPDGRVMAYIAYGRVYVRHVDEHSPTRMVTPPDSHARHRDLAWSPDGLRLYFVGDGDGTESIYKARVALTRGEIQRGEGRTADRLASPIPLHLPPHAPDQTTGQDPADPLSGLGMGGSEDPFSPVEPTDPPMPMEPEPGAGTAEPEVPPELPPEPLPPLPPEEFLPQPTEGLSEDHDPARWHDAVQFRIHPVVAEEHHDRQVSPSPDGRRIAFRRGRGDLVVMDTATGQQQTLVSSWDTALQWRWSPDGRYIAFVQNDLNFSSNIFIVPADGSQEPINITRHPRNDLNPRWSADGRKLSFISNRSGEHYDLYRVYLDPAMQDWSRRELNEYYRLQREAAQKRKPLPVRIPGAPPPPANRAAGTGDFSPDLENAWRRVERVTATPVHTTANEMTPGGDRYVFNSGNEGLITMNWDGTDRRRLGPRGDVQHLNTIGDRVVYLAGGRSGIAPLAGGAHQHPDIADRIRINLREQALQKFHEAARMIEENFYLPDMKGLDWSQLVDDYAELVERARTPSEFSDIANRLVGELAASHMGVTNPGPGSALREPSGRLGIDHEPIDLDDGRKGYRIKNVIPGSPADRGAMRLREGDIITATDLQPFESRETLLRRLRGRIGQEIVVSFERDIDGQPMEFQTLITPVAWEEFARLRYDAFREEARRRVHERSDGRLGYIHIQAMNQASLEEFHGQLYAAAEGKDGLLIDVRNNPGGHTTDRVLTSIMAAEHAYTIPAGADPEAAGHYPQDRLDAPRYTLPTNMLANEKSYSNSEILAHAFRTLERGTLVGEQTYGGVISTGVHHLIDGATVRRPFRGWFLPDGQDMEHFGAPPDLRIPQTPEDEAGGLDRQLDRAVDDLLERLD